MPLWRRASACDDRESQSAAASSCVLTTGEAADDSLALGERDAGTIVLDNDLGAGRVRGHPQAYVSAGASVPGGVLEQVLDDPPQPVRIPVYHRPCSRQVALDRDLGMPGAGGEHRPVGDVPEVDVGGGHDQSRLTARERLQTVDEATEPVRLQYRRSRGQDAAAGGLLRHYWRCRCSRGRSAAASATHAQRRRRTAGPLAAPPRARPRPRSSLLSIRSSSCARTATSCGWPGTRNLTSRSSVPCDSARLPRRVRATGAGRHAR